MLRAEAVVPACLPRLLCDDRLARPGRGEERRSTTVPLTIPSLRKISKARATLVCL
jgi:hypothetical protein